METSSPDISRTGTQLRFSRGLSAVANIDKPP